MKRKQERDISSCFSKRTPKKNRVNCNRSFFLSNAKLDVIVNQFQNLKTRIGQ